MNIRSLFRRSEIEAEMSEEMRHHVELQTHINVKAGMDPEEARYAALRQFGNVASIEEQARDARGWMWLENTMRDIAYAVRSLRKSVGYTSVVVLTLALGLGVNMALFTWFNAVAFRPLPVLSPEQLFHLTRLNENGSETKSMSYAELVAYRQHQTVFSELAASAGLNVQPADTPEFTTATGEKLTVLGVETVSTNYFAVFGVPMALGRPLVPEDENSSAALPVIVLSHRFWQNYFGGDPAIIGRTFRLRGLTEKALTIVGVTGPEFHGTRPGSPVGWVPLLMRPGESWRNDPKVKPYVLTGRLRPGVSREQAAEEIQLISRQFLVRPQAAKPETIILSRASSYLNLTAKQWMQMLPLVCLFGAVFVVSCANASNLILARTVTRQFEFAVRSALGASRWRLFAQITTENVVLGMMGGLVGWGVAAALLQFAWPWLLDMLPIAREAMIGLNLHADFRVFGFTLAVSVLAGAVGGLFPALKVTRRSVDSALKQDGSAFGRGLRVSHVRRLLAVAQLALSSALLFTTGLLVHRTLKVQLQDPGFDKSRLVILEVLAPRTFGPDQLDDARRQVLARVRALPEVVAVTAMSKDPFSSLQGMISLPMAGQIDARKMRVVHTSVPADYAATLPLPLVRGRFFNEQEISSDRVVVINETAAKTFWPEAEALGQQFDVPNTMLAIGERSAAPAADGAPIPDSSVTVVGVVRDSLIYDPLSGAQPVIYFPPASQTGSVPCLFIRTKGDSELNLAALRQIGRTVTGVVPRLATVEEVFDGAFVQYRITAWVAGMLAGISLIVAVIGLHGVMSFAVNQRVKEIGIRMALGATPGRVVSRIVIESLCLVGAGAALGYGLSAVIAVIARNMLFGLSAFNPVTGVVITLLLAGIGLLACWMPARRAAKVDPVVALRAE